MKFVSVSIAALGFAIAPASAKDCGTAASYQTAKADNIRYVGDHKEDATIVDVAQAAGSFNTLLAAAEAAGLAGVLAGEGPLTVFAPSDAAFEKLPEGTVETLLQPENRAQLANILQLHVISGKVTSDDLAGQTLQADTLGGPVSIDATDGVVVEGATVTQAEIMASNGVIHVIDTVILPDED